MVLRSFLGSKGISLFFNFRRYLNYFVDIKGILVIF